MRTERLRRRGERHQRRLSETKCNDDLSSNGDSTTAPRLSRIEELEVSDSDSEIDYPLFGSHDVSCASSVVQDDDRQFYGRMPAKESFSLTSGISSSSCNKPPLKPRILESSIRSRDDEVSSSKLPSDRNAQFTSEKG